MFIINDKLSYVDRLAEKLNKANKLVGLIRKTSAALDAEVFKAVFKAVKRRHLEQRKY